MSYIAADPSIWWDNCLVARKAAASLPSMISKGFYPFKIEFLHKQKDFGLAYTYLTPAIMNSKEPVPIPLDVQYSAK